MRNLFAVTRIRAYGAPFRLCHESHVRPLLDFRLGSYEPYRKFPTYFVGGFCSNLEFQIYDIFCRLFCSNLECILSYIYIGNLRYIWQAFFVPN